MKAFYTFLVVLITCQAFGNSLRSYEDKSLNVRVSSANSFMQDYEEVKEKSEIKDVELGEEEDTSISNEKRSLRESYSKLNLVDILTGIGVVTLAFGIGIIVGMLLAKARYSDDLKMAKEFPRIQKKLKNLESEKEKFRQGNSGYESKKNEKELKTTELNVGKQINDGSKIESVSQRMIDNDSAKTLNQEPNQNNISIYFQYPEGNGSFHKDHGTSIKGDKSYFEIVYKKDHHEGELKFVADRSNYGRILSVRDTSLSPISEIENPDDIDKPTNISIINSGVVEIKEDLFIIKEGHKLKIRIS